MMLLTIFGLSDDVIATLIITVGGGVMSLMGVYNSLSKSITALETNEANNEKRIDELKAELDKTKDGLYDSINEMKDMLSQIKVDIEKIRP